MEIEELAKIARVDQQSAYAAYTHGQSNKWVYLARVVEDCHEHFGTVESALRDKLLPAICGHQASDIERDLFSLPCRFCGLGQAVQAPDSCTCSGDLSSGNQRHQATSGSDSKNRRRCQPAFVKVLERTGRPATSCQAKQTVLDGMYEGESHDPQARLSSTLCHIPFYGWADQPDASTWLTALPLTSHGFDLTRRKFHDGLCLRYGWEPSNLPSSCSCGQRFGLERALTCRRGGYVAMRHDEVRDLFSELLAETCSNVVVLIVLKCCVTS